MKCLQSEIFTDILVLTKEVNQQNTSQPLNNQNTENTKKRKRYSSI